MHNIIKVVFIISFWLISMALIIHKCSRYHWRVINKTKQTHTDMHFKEYADTLCTMYKQLGDNCEVVPIKYKWGFLWEV